MHGGEIHYAFYDWKNSFIVIDFYKELLRKYPGKDLYIIQDAWSAHTSSMIQIFADLNPRINLVYLPTRASWLNPIERDFGSIQKFVLNGSNFKSVRETMGAIELFITKELSSS